MKRIILIILVLSLFLPVLVLSKIGVGIGTGKIQIDQPLKPGVIYDLPTVMIINTGDETSEYGVSIQYHEGQPELKPAKEWFSFSPDKFNLEPQQVQAVQVKLTLPIRGVRPGDYFAYLQGHPIRKSVSGQTSIGVAAAAKLYFTVTPSNIFVGLYYRIISIIQMWSPWSYVVFAVIAAAIIVFIFKKFFSFRISIGKK